jgi:MFS family permease
VVVLLVSVFFADLVYRQLFSTFPVFLSDHGLGTQVYGWLFAVNGGVILLLELPAAAVLRRYAPLALVGTGLVLVGLGYGLLALGAGIGTALAMMLLLTAGEILYRTPATAHVADSAPEHAQGRFQSLYAGVSVSGVVLAPPLGGALYEAAPRLLWPLCAGPAVLAGAAVLCAGRLRGAVVAGDVPGDMSGPESGSGDVPGDGSGDGSGDVSGRASDGVAAPEPGGVCPQGGTGSPVRAAAG